MRIFGKVLVGTAVLAVAALGSAAAAVPAAASGLVSATTAPRVIVFNNTGDDSGNDSVLEVDRALNENEGTGSAGSDNEGD